MIGNIEGALSSRRKRAKSIIDERGKKSSEFFIPQKKNAGCFLTAEKGENDVFHLMEVFSSRRKKT